MALAKRPISKSSNGGTSSFGKLTIARPISGAALRKLALAAVVRKRMNG